MRIKPWIGVLIGLVALTVVTGAALAEETDNSATVAATASDSSALVLAPAAAKGKDEWRFAVPVGYYWFGLDGHAAIGNFSKEIDLGSSEVGDKLDSAYGFGFNFGKGRWDFETSGRFLKFNGNQFHGEDLKGNGITIDPTIEWKDAQFLAAWTWIEHNPGPDAFVFQPVFGGRWTDLKGELEQTRPNHRTEDKSVSWEDAVLGFQLAKHFAQHWTWRFDADYVLHVAGNHEDGHDFGTNIDYTFPMDGWALSLDVGYRYNKVKFDDHNDNIFTMDLDFDGPVAGVVFSW